MTSNDKPNDGGAALVSLAEYSRRRGVSKAAISKARARGRLSNSIQIVDGRVLVDAVKADKEWVANARRLHNDGGKATNAAPAGVSARAVDSERLGVCWHLGLVALVEVKSEAPHRRHPVDCPDVFLDDACRIADRRAAGCHPQDDTEDPFFYAMTPATARKLRDALTEILQEAKP